MVGAAAPASVCRLIPLCFAMPRQAERSAFPSSTDARWRVWHREALQDGYTESLEDFVGKEGGGDYLLPIVVVLSCDTHTAACALSVRPLQVFQGVDAANVGRL